MQPTTEIKIIFHFTTQQTPLGRMTLVAKNGILCGLYNEAQRHWPEDSGSWTRDDSSIFDPAKDWLAHYFSGKACVFPGFTFAHGTKFQKQVWDALLDIPCGQTISYGELAARIGSPRAVRALGAAVGRNPISIIVPCHRVLGANGALTGYAGGLEKKQWLLAHETRWAGRPSPMTNLNFA